MKLKQIIAAAVCAVMTIACAGCTKDTPSSQPDAPESAPSQDAPAGEENDLTSLEVIRLMGNGINLGNTLEAYAHWNYLSGSDPTSAETVWGQPKTTAEMINGMKAAGFDTLRIPVAWTNGMNFESGDYTIDERLMARVEEVVNYALDADMYVIINDHWDGGWWGMFGSPDENVRKQADEMYKSMWTQIGTRFKNYSYKLIFEAANEELGDRLNDSDITGVKGTLSKDECYAETNRINSEFVKTIRALGGRNSDRFLLIAGYNTDITCTADDRFVMPEDTAQNKLLLSVHYYTPWDYCGTESINQWGSVTDYNEQNKLFKTLSKFSEAGYGVVIGEYAVMSSKGVKPDTDKFYTNVMDNCDLYDFCPVLWDCSDFFKRSTLTASDETLAALFLARSYDNEKSKSLDDIKTAAQNSLDSAMKNAEDEMLSDIDIPAADDKAVAWIMFASGDYSVSYCVGDIYDPTNKTKGIVAKNAEITGEGKYTVSLDFSGCGAAKGCSFSALGISNGETLFPDYVITIEQLLINGEPAELSGKNYTSSDDGKCTRTNLYNGWVGVVPDDARTLDSDISGCSAQIMNIGAKQKVNSIEITFSFDKP